MLSPAVVASRGRAFSWEKFFGEGVILYKELYEYRYERVVIKIYVSFY